jgi:hypothetical protein
MGGCLSFAILRNTARYTAVANDDGDDEQDELVFVIPSRPAPQPVQDGLRARMKQGVFK